MNLQQPEALIFDMDGTLFQTETIFVPAYERAYRRLVKEGFVSGQDPMPSVSLLLSSIGMVLKDIWAKLLPNAQPEARERLDRLLMEELLALLKEGKGELYPEVEPTLRALKERGFRLFVASNGLKEYVSSVAEQFGIQPLFEGLYAAGEYRTGSKVELVRLLLDKSGVSSAWMVGDRSSDVDAGLANGLYVVGCDYARFGDAEKELAKAHVRIRTFGELLQLAEIAH